jgi:hypothetical protein
MFLMLTGLVAIRRVNRLLDVMSTHPQMAAVPFYNDLRNSRASGPPHNMEGMVLVERMDSVSDRPLEPEARFAAINILRSTFTGSRSIALAPLPIRRQTSAPTQGGVTLLPEGANGTAASGAPQPTTTMDSAQGSAKVLHFPESHGQWLIMLFQVQLLGNALHVALTVLIYLHSDTAMWSIMWIAWIPPLEFILVFAPFSLNGLTFFYAAGPLASKRSFLDVIEEHHDAPSEHERRGLPLDSPRRQGSPRRGSPPAFHACSASL